MADKKPVHEKYDVRVNDTNTALSVSISGFPKELWKIWDRQCKQSFNDIRWIKIWTDHLKAQSYDLLVKSQYLIIEKNLVSEEKKEEKESNGLGLLNPDNENE